MRKDKLNLDLSIDLRNTFNDLNSATKILLRSYVCHSKIPSRTHFIRVSDYKSLVICAKKSISVQLIPKCIIGEVGTCALISCGGQTFMGTTSERPSDPLCRLATERFIP